MIYFIQAGESGAVKIGYAKTVAAIKQRVLACQTYNAETMSLLGYVEGDRSVEAEFHEMFAADRIRGEWFRPSSDLLDVAHFKQHARVVLDYHQTTKRWIEWGVIDRAGSVTEFGRMYFAACEYRLSEDGYMPENWIEGNADLREAA